MRKTLTQFLIALFIMGSCVLGYLEYRPFWQPFEYKIKDLMFQTRGAFKGDERIVIIDIDEKSLKTLGQWPWSRDKVATLLQNLSELGVAIIGLDVVFAEPDNSSPKRIFERLNRPIDDTIPDYDAIFAETINQTPTIVGYVFALTKDDIAPEGTPKSAAIIIEQNRPEHSYVIKPYRPILNLPSIQKEAYSSGYFNTVPDSDGIVRSVPLIMEYDGILYPSLSLEIVRILLEENKITVAYDENGIQHIAMTDRLIPTDFFGRLNINYRGKQHSYHYISALDVYEKNINPTEIENKIALVGTSAAGLMDLRSTPFSSVYAGVEVHANAIDNMLNQDFIAQPIWARGADFLSILAVTLCTFFILLLPSALGSFLALLVLNTTIIATHYYSIVYQGIVFTTLLPLLAINLLFVLGQAINYFLEIRQKELIKHKFASKVSPAVMNDILSTEGDVLAGKEKEITVFFSDVRNFTNISEAMGDPKRLIAFMNTYMDPMTEIIIKTGGTVDKFIGDAIMAYWNAPVDVEDHADKAVLASLQQLRTLKHLNQTIRDTPEFVNVVEMADQKGMTILDIGIGLNTGIAIVGEMGSTDRSDYTVIGDPINLGSRLESLCKYYNSHLTISHFTKEHLKESYLFRFLDLVTVKGKSEPVEIWQIHDSDAPQKEPLYDVSYNALKKELADHHHGIERYKAAAFEEALALFENLDANENKTNHAIYKIYIERCHHYIAHPPTSFNGVFEHTTKG